MLAQFHTLGMQFLAATVLGISNTIAGWLSHDYVHGRGKFCDFMRPFGHICGGMSPTWWSDKVHLLLCAVVRARQLLCRLEL